LAQRPARNRICCKDLQWVRAVVRAFDQCIETELLGAHDEVDIVRETGAHILTRRMLALYDQAQFHAPFSLNRPRHG
jgi:hypothetical protein